MTNFWVSDTRTACVSVDSGARLKLAGARLRRRPGPTSGPPTPRSEVAPAPRRRPRPAVGYAADLRHRDAQPPRQDVIWARVATGPITLDGVLDEPEWAQAETMVIEYASDAGIPGSGWKAEAGLFVPPDPTRATLRLLAIGNELYLAVEVEDNSVGGSEQFNRFDGLLMSIKDHNNALNPKPPAVVTSAKRSPPRLRYITVGINPSYRGYPVPR